MAKKKAHGGRRKGAGRKPGSATVKTRKIADLAMESGISPLEFMLNVMRDAPNYEQMTAKEVMAACLLRFEAAKAAAPYVHPKLAAVEHSGPDGGPLQFGVTLNVIGIPANRAS